MNCLHEKCSELKAKSVLVPLGLTAVASAIDAATHQKMFGPDAATHYESS